MSYVGRVSAAGDDHFVASTAYGTCATAAGTAAKVVVMEDFDTLLTGVTVHVLFQNSNTAASPTLNVNNTGAKPIYISGVNSPGITAEASWDANSIVSFTYDGNAWRMNDPVKAIRDVVDTLKSKGLSLTALASDWSDTIPATQTLAATGVTANNNIIVNYGATITSAQYDDLGLARMVCSSQSDGYITLTCYGATPTTDIPISVVILG